MFNEKLISKKISVIDIFIFITIVLLSTNTYVKVSRIPIFLYFLVSLFIIMVYKRIKSNKNILIVNKRYYIFYYVSLIFLFFGCISFFKNYSASGDIKIFANLVINIMSMFTISIYIDSIKRLKIVLLSIIAGLIVNFIAVFFELSYGLRFVELIDDYVRMFKGIPLSFYSNANDFATYLGCVLFILFFYYYFLNSKKSKFFIILIFGVTIYVILLTKSRGGLFFVISFLAIYFFFLLINKFGIYGKKRLLFYLIIFLMYSVIFIYIINSKYVSLFDLNGRYELWSNILSGYSNNSFLPMGLYGTYTNNGTIVFISGTSHFFFLEILAKYGIFMLILILILYFKLFIVKKSTKNVFLINAFLISFLFLQISTSGIGKMYLLWCIAGVLISYKYKLTKESELIVTNNN